VEEQAIDRVHRLNQTIDVKIYKITIKDTVEERILDLQERKRELANATIEGKAAAAKLTMRDMIALFGHDAEAKFREDDHWLDLGARTRLLDSKGDDGTSDHYSFGSSNGVASLSTSSSFSQQGRRATPPVIERGSGSKRVVQENPVYGRRW
jgi:hypothetical protein